MKHLGDITKISGYEVPIVDVVTGGSPCQDLSIAGKREGLAGERSGLFMEQIRIIKEMREKELQSGKTINDIRPRYMVWENVPGAFSSNKGEDFRAVLEETAKVKDPTVIIPGFKKWQSAGCIMGNGYSIAWRVHDAQYWGVPQRRKRISLVADFNGNTAPEILFKSDCLPGDIEKGGEQGQSSSSDVARGIGKAISFQERGGKPGGGKGILIQDEHIGAMNTNPNQYVCQNNAEVIGFNRGNGSGIPTLTEKQPTIQAAAGESGNNQPLVCQPILLESNQNHATIQTEGISTTLPASMGMGGGYVPMITDKVVALTTEMTPKIDENQTSFSLRGRDYKDAQCVAYGIDFHNQSQSEEKTKSLNNSAADSDYIPHTYQKVVGTLSSGSHAGSYNGQDAYNDLFITQKVYAPDTDTYQKVTGTLDCCIAKGTSNQIANNDMLVCNSIVRRLTPLECERLQGFPDDWTNIGDWVDSKGKKHKGESDAPRYKALGNSIALPFWEWLAKRICQYDVHTMASLFDGIGGFPLSFQRAGCEPVWASEIEEFPIAVTKMRFGEE